jgi:excisionase family DNA binding protein
MQVGQSRPLPAWIAGHSPTGVLNKRLSSSTVDGLVDSIQAHPISRTAGIPLPPNTALAYRVNDAAKVAGLSRSSLYLLIAEGKLRSVLVAGRRLIPADALRDLLRGAA